jgi:peptidoglycan L-alanyl-D-glutamate endopeptidase CwlK
MPAKFDERSERNIATLHPRMQQLARSFLSGAIPICKAYGFDVRIISGTRTYAEQNALYAQGRTAKGKVVTNARAGFSRHNFGIAFDIGIFKDKRYYGDHSLYTECGLVGESLGLEWGGRWKKLVDRPHFEAKTGLTLAQMRQRVASGTDLFA